MYAEFMGAIYAVEHAWNVGFTKLWMECDSDLVCQAFSSPWMVPSMIRGRWRKCFKICNDRV